MPESPTLKTTDQATPALMPTSEDIERLAEFMCDEYEGEEGSFENLRPDLRKRWVDLARAVLSRRPVAVPPPREDELRKALEYIAESHDAGRHDGLPEECPAHDAYSMWWAAREALSSPAQSPAEPSADQFPKSPKRIYLEPECQEEDRSWSEDRHDCDEEGCGLEAVEYIRADLVARVNAGEVVLHTPWTMEKVGGTIDTYYIRHGEKFWYLGGIPEDLAHALAAPTVPEQEGK